MKTQGDLMDGADFVARLPSVPGSSVVKPNSVRETFWRSVVKSLSYRLQATFTTIVVAWLITGQWRLAAAIGCGDAVIKMVGFYLHERMWNRISFGRHAEAPDYEI